MGHSPWKRQRLARGRLIGDRGKNKSWQPAFRSSWLIRLACSLGKPCASSSFGDIDQSYWLGRGATGTSLLCALTPPRLLGFAKDAKYFLSSHIPFLADDRLSPQTCTFQWENSQRIWSSENGTECSVMVSTFLGSTPVHKSIYMASILNNWSQGTQLQEKTVIRGNDLPVCFQTLQK